MSKKFKLFSLMALLIGLPILNLCFISQPIYAETRVNAIKNNRLWWAYCKGGTGYLFTPNDCEYQVEAVNSVTIDILSVGYKWNQVYWAETINNGNESSYVVNYNGKRLAPPGTHSSAYLSSIDVSGRGSYQISIAPTGSGKVTTSSESILVFKDSMGNTYKVHLSRQPESSSSSTTNPSTGSSSSTKPSTSSSSSSNNSGNSSSSSSSSSSSTSTSSNSSNSSSGYPSQTQPNYNYNKYYNNSSSSNSSSNHNTSSLSQTSDTSNSANDSPSNETSDDFSAYVEWETNDATNDEYTSESTENSEIHIEDEDNESETIPLVTIIITIASVLIAAGGIITGIIIGKKSRPKEVSTKQTKANTTKNSSSKF